MKTKLLSVGLLLAMTNTACYAQDILKQSNEESVTPLRRIDQMPEFPGGKPKLMEYLRDNIHYPASAAKLNLEGQVVAEFVVSAKGEISNITIKRHMSLDCDDEVKRVIKNMPKWKPGINKGRAVPVYYLLPVTFKLNNQPSMPERR